MEILRMKRHLTETEINRWIEKKTNNTLGGIRPSNKRRGDKIDSNLNSGITRELEVLIRRNGISLDLHDRTRR